MRFGPTKPFRFRGPEILSAFESIELHSYMEIWLGEKIRYARRFFGILLSIALPLVVCPATATDFLDLPSPPDNAPAGQKLEGIQIGLWTEKSVYRRNEIRNVWRFALSDRKSGITIGVGGNLYERSPLYFHGRHRHCQAAHDRWHRWHRESHEHCLGYIRDAL